MSLFEQENTTESLYNMGNHHVFVKDIVDFDIESLVANNQKKS